MSKISVCNTYVRYSFRRSVCIILIYLHKRGYFGGFRLNLASPGKVSRNMKENTTVKGIYGFQKLGHLENDFKDEAL